MALGLLKKLVHLSQQPCMPNTRLVPDHNDKGYGIIEEADGGEIYFSHEAVPNRGFDDLHQGQQLEYTLEPGMYRRATLVRATFAVPIAHRPAA